ncbi:MAG: phospho-sugar mutase, partial [Lysinibacillus sp.]
QRGVVIAYDTRHFSYEFALETARVLGAQGVRSYVFCEPRPTPELSFAVRHLYTMAGVVITASHNPQEYNGFKVYGEDGAQLTSAGANTIDCYMDELENLFELEVSDFEQLQLTGLSSFILEEIDCAYFSCLSHLQERSDQDVAKDLRIVYTPLHGAGLVPVTKGLAALNFKEVYIVAEQAEQNGAFPTVQYPNPEEETAFELARILGHAKNAHILLATDPDGDRLGVAVRDGEDYSLLTGNQLGALLLHYLLQAKTEKRTLSDNSVMLKTIVTSELGAAIAESYGVATINTLTGFKYIAEQIEAFTNSGEKTFVFGYEESYGYLIKSFVRDKDAVQVALVTAEMAGFYLKQGKTLLLALNDLYEQFGYYKEALVSQIFEGKAGQEQMRAVLANFRANVPEKLAGVAVEHVEDYLSGEIKFADGSMEWLDLPKENVLKYVLADASWVAIRPSGTEPKCKYYFGVVGKSPEEAAAKLMCLQSVFIN